MFLFLFKKIYISPFFLKESNLNTSPFVSQEMSDNSGDSSPQNVPQPDDVVQPSPVSPPSSSSSNGIKVIHVSTERWLDENRLGNISDSSAGPDLNLENIPGPKGPHAQSPGSTSGRLVTWSRTRPGSAACAVDVTGRHGLGSSLSRGVGWWKQR